MKSQNQVILEYLKAGNTITAKRAERAPFYCMRLAARIADLRRDGYHIETTILKRKSPRTGKPVRFARYFMGALWVNREYSIRINHYPG